MQASEGTTTASAHLAFCDANGNITDYIAIYPDGSGETNGTVVARYQYDPYGNLIEQNGPEADTLRFRISSKYYESELETDTSDGLYYYGYRFYNPTLGRWVSRDPIGEDGGINVYGFVSNNSADIWDILGLDFIAVADREVDGTKGAFYHYSLQYYESDCNPKLGEEMTVAEFLLKNPKAKKIDSFELLRDGGWEVWVYKRRGLSPVKSWGIENVSVSIIHYNSDRSDSFAASFSSPNDLVVYYKWAEMKSYAQKYIYAEQEGFKTGGAPKFINWPFSKYQIPIVDDPANNSNTFIRYIVRKAGLPMYELKGPHPGRDVPASVPDIYRKHKPWRKGTTPPPPF